MPNADVLPVNFTLSSSAKAAIEELQAKCNAEEPNSAALLSIGWGTHRTGSGREIEGIAIGFYSQSVLPDVSYGIQYVSGVPFIYFTIQEYHGLFEGKILDYNVGKQFFLRSAAG